MHMTRELAGGMTSQRGRRTPSADAGAAGDVCCRAAAWANRPSCRALLCVRNGARAEGSAGAEVSVRGNQRVVLFVGRQAEDESCLVFRCAVGRARHAVRSAAQPRV